MEKLINPAPKESSNRTEDVEDAVFVAVGKEVEASKLTLLWAIRNSGGKKICILHVHQFAKRKLILGGMSKTKTPEMERAETSKVLEEYHQFCAKEGVKSDHLCYYTNGPIERGIIKMVADPENRVRVLVMGAASDSKYSKKMTEPTSKKAIYVWKNTPAYCNIWFICKGNFIYTTRGCLPEMRKPQQLTSGEPSTSKTHVDSERKAEDEVKGTTHDSSDPGDLGSVMDSSKVFQELLEEAKAAAEKSKQQAYEDSMKRPVASKLLQAEDKSCDSSDPNDLGSDVNLKLCEELEKAKAVTEKSKRQADEDLMKCRIAERESHKAIEKAKEELEKRRKAQEELTIATEELEDLKENQDSILEDLAKAKEELAKANKELEDTKNESVVFLGEICADLDEKSSLVIRVEKVE